MNIAQWLAAIAWPIISKVLVAAGVGTVTYIGINSAINSALSAAKNSFSGAPVEVLQLLAMAGLFEAFSIISGALLAAVAFQVTKKFALKNVGA